MTSFSAFGLGGLDDFLGLFFCLPVIEIEDIVISDCMLDPQVALTINQFKTVKAHL